MRVDRRGRTWRRGALAALIAVLAVTSISSSAPRRVLLDASASSGQSTLTAPGGIDCGDDCDARYRPGSIVEVTATPSIDEQFVRWGGACAGVAPSCSLFLERATRVRAVFVPISQTVRMTVGGPGTVESQPLGMPTVPDSPAGLRCGAQAVLCSAIFGQGRTIVLRPVPDADGVFAGWGGACAGEPIEPARCTMTVGANDAVANRVTAWFRHRAPAGGPQTLTVGGGHAQYIRSSPAGLAACEATACSASFASGTEVTLDGPGQWDGDCVGTIGRCTVVADAPINTAAHPPLQQASRGGNPIKVSVSGRGRVTAGSKLVCDGPRGKSSKCEAVFTRFARVTLVAKATPGFKFKQWSDPDCKGRRPTCTLKAYASLRIGAVFNGS